jgi:hypothetical protein
MSLHMDVSPFVYPDLSLLDVFSLSGTEYYVDGTLLYCL